MYEPTFRTGDTDPPQPTAMWTVRDMVICTVVVLIALFLITTAIVGPAIAHFGRGAPETLVASSAANLLWNASMIVAVLYFVRRSGSSVKDLGLRAPRGYERPWPRAVGVTIGFALLAYISLNLMVLAYGLVVQVFGLEFLEPDQQIPDEFYDSTIALIALGIAVVISAPITEEIFFRSFLFGGARRYIGVLPAALVTGFIFSLAHYNPGLIIPFTVVGAVLALAYHRTGSIHVAIGAHLLFNLVSFSVLVFVPDARP